MTRIRVSRIAKTTASRRAALVCPRAAYRGSRCACSMSGATRSGRLKNTCSHSPWETWCRSQFLSALPEVAEPARISTNHHRCQRHQEDLADLLPLVPGEIGVNREEARDGDPCPQGEQEDHFGGARQPLLLAREQYPGQRRERRDHPERHVVGEPERQAMRAHVAYPRPEEDAHPRIDERERQHREEDRHEQQVTHGAPLES